MSHKGVAIRGALIGLGLLAAACQGRNDTGATTQATPKAAAPPPAVAALPVEATPPAAAEPIDAALAAVKAFNEAAPPALVSIGEQEAKIRAAAAQALTAARGADAAAEGQREALSGRVAAARRQADAARKAITDGEAKWAADGAAQTAAVQAAVEACAADPLLVTYAGCVALPAEQVLLATNIEALTARYQAADAGYGVERAKLEEAAAALALAALR